MNSLVAIKRSLILGVALLVTPIVAAQEKYVETFSATKDIVIDVNTSYTNVIFDTWNKDKVQVEAFIEGDDLTKQEKQENFDAWDFEVVGNSKKVKITSSGSNSWEGIGELSDMDFAINLEFLGPLMEEMPEMDFEMPEMPEELFELQGLHFDYNEFQKDEEGYMKEWEAQVEEVYGKDFEEKMEAWGEEFGKKFEEKYGEEYQEKMEAWGEELEEKMEAWSEKYEEEIERKAEEMERSAEKLEKYYKTHNTKNSQIITSPDGKTIIINGSKPSNFKGKRTLRIKMPKNAKTNINVRHGEVKMAHAYNMKATLNHAAFAANSIDGGKTLIDASYAPVVISNWNEGKLKVNYVDKCVIDNANVLVLQANSSNVKLKTILNNAHLVGSFGFLYVDEIAPSFKKLDVILENTNANLALPNAPFSFQFSGKKSPLQYPKSLVLSKEKHGDEVFLKTENQSTPLINVQALFSNVNLEKGM